jgi:hypothetical protein
MTPFNPTLTFCPLWRQRLILIPGQAGNRLEDARARLPDMMIPTIPEAPRTTYERVEDLPIVGRGSRIDRPRPISRNRNQ